ncbi:MAG TPA: S8 family serine peptidase [Acidimicrobiales bacterium]|nr:S8 family serine peptidase [Acidimicrobiales bacterium]
MVVLQHRRRRPVRAAGALLVAVLLLLGAPAGASVAPAGGPRLSGRLVLHFAPRADEAAQRGVLQRFGLRAGRRVGGLGEAVMSVTARHPVSRGALLADPAVAEAAPEAVFHAAAANPNDGSFPLQYNLRLIQVPAAWDVSTGAGATVAVLDSGVAYRDATSGGLPYPQAKDLAGTAFVPGYDIVSNDDQPIDELSDYDSANPNSGTHGTSIATVIAATTNNGIGGAAVAPGVAVMPVRVLARDQGTGEYVGTDIDIANGIIWAVDHGANVINMSFTAYSLPTATRDAVAYAAANGVTMVAAAGNDPALHVGWPARFPDVISVGAVDSTKASTFATGQDLGDIDLVAPGGTLAVPDIVGETVFPDNLGLPKTEFYNFAGTSYSAAEVSGVAGLLLGPGYARTPAQVRDFLTQTAEDLGSPGQDTTYGWGLVQARAALDLAASRAADVSVAATGTPSNVAVGDTVTYTATVSNAGPASATAVTLADYLPSGRATTATSSQGTCSTAGAAVTCQLGGLAVGASATVVVTAVPGAAGSFASTFAVSRAEGDGNRGNDAATVTTSVGAEVIAPPAVPPGKDAPPPPGSGYWLVASDGGVFSFGGARFLGSTGTVRLNQPIVTAMRTPSGDGYWLVASDGGVFAFGDARFLGSTGDLRLNRPIVAAMATPTGNGYWLVASDGGVFAFGDARFLGSTGAIALTQPMAAAAPSPTGNGYWLVASDGGVFAFGDARYLGSTGRIRLTQPVVAAAALPTGNGYWLVAADGGVFAFGLARYFGSTGSIRLSRPITSAAPAPDGDGYWLVASDGGVFAFGSARFHGSTGAMTLNQPVTAMAPR